MSAGFGAPSLLGDLSPELIARLLQTRPDQAGPGSPDALLFDRGGMGGGANGFSGTSGAIAEPRPPAQAGGVLSGVLRGPQATGALSKPSAADDEDRAPPSPNAPGARPVPLPPARPAEFSQPEGVKPVDSFDPLTGQPVSGSPKPLVQPAPSSGGGLSSILGGLFGGGNNDPWLSNTLLGLGAGILSGKTFGEGLGRGFDNVQRYNALQAQTDLASAKAKREQAALGGNASILKRAYPQLSDAELAAMASNSGNVTTALQILRDPTHGMPKTPEQIQAEARASAAGSMEGSAKPVERIQAEAQAQAAGAAAGKPAEAYNLSPGQTRYDGETNKPIAAVPAKPDDTASQKEYEAAKREGFTGSFLDFIDRKGNATRAQTTINNAVNPILKGLGDQFVSSAETARSAAEQVRAIQSARAQLDGPGGIISGFRAGDRLSLQKVGALLGVTDPNAVQNTEALRAALKPMVLEAVKGLGSNPSNGDRTFAEDFSGGNIGLDEGSIRRILDINERSARAKIGRHNALSDQMLATQPELKQVGPMMRVEAPEMAQPAPAPQGTETPAMGPLEKARAAIQAGADPNKVKTRLLKMGVDPRGL